jgi:predicted ATPase
MDKLIMKDVRCFSDVEAPLAPLTILVGENSTGKSSFLALLRLAWDLVSGQRDLDFNEDPFRLGAYDHIARYHGGKGKRVTTFSLGLEGNRTLKQGQPVRIVGTFAETAGQPALREVDFSGAGTEPMKVSFEANTTTRSVSVGDHKFSVPSLPASLPWLELLRFLPRIGSLTVSADIEEVGRVAWQTAMSVAGRHRPVASAPVRTAPERIYSPERDTPVASGRHVPMLLARLAASESKEWAPLRDAIVEFGRACGLLESLAVKRKGKTLGDPFEIAVEIAGGRRSVNLMDVGYGVSQVLPLLVDSLRAPKGSWLLVQQPEVHLHPRAQAEVGTFLSSLTRGGRRFVVETHSDHLVDRVCMDVRDGRGVKHTDVVILYFERKDAGVVIHPIRLDSEGNLLDVPDGYRSFFLREEMRHIGFSEAE